MTPRYTMVIGVDLSEYADGVLQHGFDQALRHHAPIVHVVTVVAEPAAVAAAQERLASLVRRTLEDAIPEPRRQGWTILLHVRRGAAAQEVVDLAAEVSASLLVVGRVGLAAHRRGEHGSTADRVVATADCPVLVVTPPRDTTASDAQCPACVAVRNASDGEQWFCPAHHGDRVGHAILSVGSAAWSTAGHSLW